MSDEVNEVLPATARYTLFGRFERSLGGVDWDLLHSQKQALLDLVAFLKDDHHDDDPCLRSWGEVIEGILVFLDHLQDDAADSAGIWKFPSPAPTTTLTTRIAGVDMTVHFEVDANGRPTGKGEVESGLHETILPEADPDEDERIRVARYNDTIDGIEALILAHACTGIDIASEDYGKGVFTAVEAAVNAHS